MTKLAVETKKLSKSYAQNTILTQVDFSVPAGKICGVIGKSGTGKTTLLRCLNGLEPPDTGQILIGGEELTRDSQQRLLHKIGSIFQNLNLLSRRTVLENVLLPVDLLGKRSEKNIDRAKELIDLVGLTERTHHYPRQLSGGQQQRVAIARALAFEASLLLCDEFTSALDPETILEILALIRDLNQRLGVTVVLITHDMEVIREICDYVTVLDQGQIVESGPIESILLSPSHPVTQSFVSHLFEKDLPHWLQERLTETPQSETILRLTFSGRTAQDPVVAELISRFSLAINIISGHMDHIRHYAFGTLLISFPTDLSRHAEIMQFLEESGVAPEVLGYYTKEAM